MPANRFIHQKLGHSEKVSALTDFEFRVWIQYMLSANDFGVMRFSAATMQADNDALHERPARQIEQALEKLVTIRLLDTFTHQKTRYVFQTDWHRWQRFNLPSRTILPAPPQDALDRCEPGTAALFYERHPDLVGVASTQRVDAASTDIVDGHQIQPQHTSNGKRLTATGSIERFTEFWKYYPRKVGKNAAWRAWQKINPDSDLLATMLTVLAWQSQQDAWLRDGGRFIPHPATWLNQGRWQDEPHQAPQVADSTLKTARAVQEFLKS